MGKKRPESKATTPSLPMKMQNKNDSPKRNKSSEIDAKGGKMSEHVPQKKFADQFKKEIDLVHRTIKRVKNSDIHDLLLIGFIHAIEPFIEDRHQYEDKVVEMVEYELLGLKRETDEKLSAIIDEIKEGKEDIKRREERLEILKAKIENFAQAETEQKEKFDKSVLEAKAAKVAFKDLQTNIDKNVTRPLAARQKELELVEEGYHQFLKAKNEFLPDDQQDLVSSWLKLISVEESLRMILKKAVLTNSSERSVFQVSAVDMAQDAFSRLMGEHDLAIKELQMNLEDQNKKLNPLEEEHERAKQEVEADEQMWKNLASEKAALVSETKQQSKDLEEACKKSECASEDLCQANKEFDEIYAGVAAFSCLQSRTKDFYCPSDWTPVRKAQSARIEKMEDEQIEANLENEVMNMEVDEMGGDEEEGELEVVNGKGKTGDNIKNTADISPLGRRPRHSPFDDEKFYRK